MQPKLIPEGTKYFITSNGFEVLEERLDKIVIRYKARDLTLEFPRPKDLFISDILNALIDSQKDK